jgi:hypothetical protein
MVGHARWRGEALERNFLIEGQEIVAAFSVSESDLHRPPALRLRSGRSLVFAGPLDRLTRFARHELTPKYPNFRHTWCSG